MRSLHFRRIACGNLGGEWPTTDDSSERAHIPNTLVGVVSDLSCCLSYGPDILSGFGVLVAASNTNAAGNCIGKCYPGIRQQGKLGVTVGNLAANLGAPSGLEVFSYFASDSELKRFYAKGKPRVLATDL